MRKGCVPATTNTVNINILLNGLYEMGNDCQVMKQF